MVCYEYLLIYRDGLIQAPLCLYDCSVFRQGQTEVLICKLEIGVDLHGYVCARSCVRVDRILLCIHVCVRVCLHMHTHTYNRYMHFLSIHIHARARARVRTRTYTHPHTPQIYVYISNKYIHATAHYSHTCTCTCTDMCAKIHQSYIRHQTALSINLCAHMHTYAHVHIFEAS